MRRLGLILMLFGIFCVLTVVTGLLEPTLRAAGIPVRAETTSLVGTGLIGVFALLSGALLRRRAVDEAAARMRRERVG